MKVSILFLALVASLALHGQNHIPLKGPYGGEVYDIVLSGTTLIASVPGQGIVLSTDGGASWEESNTGITNFFIRDFEIDPTSGKVYALADRRLFSSSDDGQTWITEASTGFSGARFIKRTDTFFFIATEYEGRVYRSKNGGSWSLLSTITSSQITDFKANAAGNLFVSTAGSAVWRSIDEGLTFTQLDATEGLNTFSVYSLSINGSDIYALAYEGPYKSSNNGDSWSSVKSATLTDNAFVGAIHSEGSSLHIINTGNVWYSGDGGSTWSARTYPLAAYPQPIQVQSFFAESASVIYAGFWDVGLFKTTDGGLTWSEANTGITGHNAYNDNSLMYVAASNRLLYATSYPYGFYMSIDDGEVWDFVKNAPNNKRVNGFVAIGSNIYSYGLGLNRSTDNALSWNEVNDGMIGGCHTTLEALVNKDATTFYSYATRNCAGTDAYYLLTSTNAGADWTRMAITNMPSTASSYVEQNNFHIDSDGNLYLLVYNYEVNESQLYKINPATAAASQINNFESSYIADMDSYAGTLYLLTNDRRLLVSADGGTTWTTKPTTAGYGKIEVVNENAIYILNSDPGAIISTDGGNNWSVTESFGNFRAANHVVLTPSNYAYIQVQFGNLLKSVGPVIPPSAPTDLTVKGFSEDDVALTWIDNSNNEDYFIIERSANNNTTYDSVAFRRRPNGYPQNFVYAELGGLDPETQYFFRVRAKGAGGTSAYSDEVSITTLKDCRAISNIPLNRSWTATTLNESGVGVKTDAVVTIGQWAGSAGYYMVSNLNIGASDAIHPDYFAPIVENCGSVFMYANADMQQTNGTWNPETETLTIHWQTLNYDPAFKETTVFQLNDVDPAPAAPTNVSAYVKTPEEIVVSWAGSTFSNEYQLQRSNTSGTGFVNVGDPVDNKTLLYLDNSDFTLGNTYYYRVIAIGSGGVSPPSAEAIINFQTPLFDAISLVGFDYSTQGIAWADVDNDNDEDLLVSPFVGAQLITSPIKVFENLGDGSLQLTNVPGISEYVSNTFRSISVGDVNNDGLMDLLTNATGSAGGDIFINKGTKNFERLSLVAPNSSPYNWYGELADFNNDGRLDATYSEKEDAASYAFFTQSETGTFEPYEVGVIAADENLSYGATWVDYDNDGDQDFLRGNALVAATAFDQLYENNGDGTFSPVTGTAFETDGAFRSRSFSWADIDNDLDLDLFIGNNVPGQSNMLYRNNGDGSFQRMTASIVAQPKTQSTFGSAWGDLDNDGDQDLVVGNTAKSDLFFNDGSGVLTKYSGTEYIVATDATRNNIAFALADFDNNGTLDIATGKNIPENIAFPTILLKNNLVPGATSHWFKVRLNGTSSNRAGIGARIIITTPDSKKQMRAISSHTGYGSCSSLIAHFGLKNQTSVTSIQIHWPSGIVQNVSAQSADQMITITEDGAGPVGSILFPLNEGINVPLSTNLQITFDELPSVQTGKKFFVYLTSDLSTPVYQLDAAEGLPEGNKVTFDPPADLEPLTSYTVVLEAGSFTDIFGNPSPEITWTFTTVDVIKPQISFIAPASVAKGGATAFLPLVTDNVSVTQVMLHYRKVSEKDYLTVAGTLNPLVENQYVFPIPASYPDETGLEYYLTATDPALNESRSPATGTHKTYVLYQEADTNIPTLGFGGDKNDWRIFAIPFDLDDNSIATVFDEVINNPELEVKFDYGILSYKDDIAWSEYPSFTTVQRGKGYFSNIVSPLSVRVGNNLLAPANDRGNLFSLDLKAGWNMIGNPYLSTISWSDVAALNGLTGTTAEVKKYVSGQYSADDQNLQPYEGGFVYSDAAISGVMIPFQGQVSEGGRRGGRELGSDIDAESWMLKLTLHQGVLQNNLGAIGMVPDASASFDDYDDITPPRLFDYLEGNFLHPEYAAKRFSRDVVPTRESYRWDLTVDSNLPGLGELSWDHNALSSARNKMFLLDTERYRIIDMKSTGSYKFDPAYSRSFSIYFGDDPEISSSVVGLGPAYPNPASDFISFVFSLPDQGGVDQMVTLEILNALGQEVATPVNGRFDPGYHEVLWNARDMTSGLYTYRLTVSARNKKDFQIRKLIIK